MKNTILILVAFLLTSCAGNQKQSVSFPTYIGTAPTRVFNTQTPTQKSPTNTPVFTPSPTSMVYEFPSWMKNPNTVILAARFKNDIEKIQKIYFFDATTGEKFEMTPAVDFSRLFWYDNMNFGLITKDSKTAYKYNLQSGMMHIEKDFIAHHLWRSQFQSVGKSYTAEWSEDMNVIKAKDAATGQRVWESSLLKNRHGTELLWSPAHESHMAFLQGSPDDLNGFITKDMTLTIVDVAGGKVLATFDGDFGNLEWSPDGKMILYLNSKFRYRNYGIPFRDAPCILFWETGEKRCLRSIPRLIPAGYELLTTGVYTWADDSNSIFYTYVYSLPSKWNILGNLCNYSLIDSHINCPTQNLEALKKRSVIFYVTSPDTQYIYFCYSESTILNDYADTSNDGVIKTDGTNFFSWVGLIQDDGSQLCSDTSWRPLP